MINEKVVFITGAGSGLGRGLSKAFCDNGSIVVGAGRSLENLKATKEIIQSEHFFYKQLDVSNSQDVEKCTQEIIKEHGKIDMLFNNAAVYPRNSFIDETSEEWEDTISINVNGVAFCCKSVLKHMIQKKEGKIFNIGSWADNAPIARSAAYSSSKGALHALTKAIHQDISELNTNVEVHEWIPGALNTQMGIETGIEPSVAAQWGVEIALLENPEKQSFIFVNNTKWEAPISLKQKIKRKLFFWKK